MSNPYPLPDRPREQRASAAVGALSFIVGCAFAVFFGSGPVSAEEQTARILLSKPPPHVSETYRKLAAAAGNHTVDVLGMSGGEVWQLGSSEVGQVLNLAETLRVSAKRLDDGAAPALKGMDARAPMSRSQSSMMAVAMSEPGVTASMMAELPAAGMVEYALTATDQAGAPISVRIALTSELAVDVVRERLVKSDGGYAWHGTIAGSDEPVTLMWWPEGRLTGQLHYRGMTYQIRPLGGTMHAVIAISPHDMPPEHAPMPAGMMKKMNMAHDPLVQEGSAENLHAMMRPKHRSHDAQDLPPTVNSSKVTVTQGETQVSPDRAANDIELTLLVAYTKKAAESYSDIRRDLIQLAIEDANASFARSGIGHIKLRLVHAYRTRYRETGTHFEHLFRFADAGDGVMEEVHAKRDRYKADIAVLIVNDPNGCGLSAGIAPPAERAFAVVHQGCTAISYSLAHEIGHLLGARHDRALDDGGAPFPYGHGYVHNNEWRTMMAYEESCGKCPRLPIWSNPDLKVRGTAAGSVDTNNARVLAERAAIVSGYR